jgi:APA family basic amino acid/polyamine antiporter
MAFAACGVVLVCVALCYAELGSMFRRNGGTYVYAREAFGPLVGFGVGWISWVTSVFSWAAVANAVSPQMQDLWAGFDEPGMVKIIALALIIGFSALNYYGIKLGAWTVNFFTIAKVIPLLIFVAVGMFFIHPENFHPFWGSSEQVDNQTRLGQFGAAVFLALWPLQGFEVTPLPSGESANPQRAVPIAAVGSLLCAAFIYVLIQTVAVGVHSGLANAGPKALAECAKQFMGSSGAKLMLVGAVISMVGFNAGNALGCPRFLSAVAEDRSLPMRIATPHPRFHTPSLAILITAALTGVAALGLSFESLVNLSNLAVILQYVATCAAVICLRYKQPDAERRFRIPFAIPVAVVGCGVSLWLLKEVKLKEFFLGGGVLAMGFMAMAIFRRSNGRAEETGTA